MNLLVTQPQSSQRWWQLTGDSDTDDAWCSDTDGVAIEVRGELKRQRLRIRSIDLQIRAAQSLLLPQLDGIARYQMNGFGDHLLAEKVPGPDVDS